jgi:hypothetical protein
MHEQQTFQGVGKQFIEHKTVVAKLAANSQLVG